MDWYLICRGLRKINVLLYLEQKNALRAIAVMQRMLSAGYAGWVLKALLGRLATNTVEQAMQYGCCRQSLQISQSKINHGRSITCKADFVPPCGSDSKGRR